MSFKGRFLTFNIPNRYKNYQNDNILHKYKCV